MTEVWTIKRLLRWTTDYFRQKGIDSPRLDAEVLLGHVLKKERIYLYVHFDEPLEPVELAAFREAVKRRAAREPVAYIIGQKEFMGLPFHVTHATLVPRPDTEILVQAAVDALRARPAHEGSAEGPDGARASERAFGAAAMAVGGSAGKESAAGAPPEEALADGSPEEKRPAVPAASASPEDALMAEAMGESHGLSGTAEETAPGGILTTGAAKEAHDMPGTAEEASLEGSLTTEEGEGDFAAASPGGSAAHHPQAAPPRFADIGTGTGAIALSVLHFVPEAAADAVDISDDALSVARQNAEALGLTTRVRFFSGDLLAPLRDAGQRGYDAILSNPPYIPDADLAELAPEVRLEEPRLALAGGADGLDFYRRLAQEAPPLLRDGGFLAVEVGIGEAADVASLFQAAGLSGIEVRKDLGGIDRVVMAWKRRKEEA